MIYVTVDSPAHNDRIEFNDSKKFVSWIIENYSEVFREEQNVRCYWHRITKSFILVRGIM